MNKELNYNEQGLYDMLMEEFPSMIEKKQSIYIQPIYNHMPNLIKKVQDVYEVEFIYDIETGTEVWFLKPLRKK
jgi:hypothetical protein